MSANSPLEEQHRLLIAELDLYLTAELLAWSNSVIHLKKCQTGFQSICTIVSSIQNFFSYPCQKHCVYYGHLNHIILICIFLMINNISILSTVHVFIGFCRHTSAQYLFIFFAFSLALIFKYCSFVCHQYFSQFLSSLFIHIRVFAL